MADYIACRVCVKIIYGQGVQLFKKLLSHFKSVTAIKKADINELKAVSGISERDAAAIIKYYEDK